MGEYINGILINLISEAVILLIYFVIKIVRLSNGTGKPREDQTAAEWDRSHFEAHSTRKKNKEVFETLSIIILSAFLAIVLSFCIFVMPVTLFIGITSNVLLSPPTGRFLWMIGTIIFFPCSLWYINKY